MTKNCSKIVKFFVEKFEKFVGLINHPEPVWPKFFRKFGENRRKFGGNTLLFLTDYFLPDQFLDDSVYRVSRNHFFLNQIGCQPIIFTAILID